MYWLVFLLNFIKCTMQHIDSRSCFFSPNIMLPIFIHVVVSTRDSFLLFLCKCAKNVMLCILGLVNSYLSFRSQLWCHLVRCFLTFTIHSDSLIYYRPSKHTVCPLCHHHHSINFISCDCLDFNLSPHPLGCKLLKSRPVFDCF